MISTAFVFLCINLVIVYIPVTDQEEQDSEKKMALASPSDVMEMVFIETLCLLVGGS